MIHVRPLTVWAVLLSWPALCATTSQQEKISLCLALHDTREAYRLIEEQKTTDDESIKNPETLALLFDYLAETNDVEGMRILFEKAKAQGPIDLPQSTLEHIAWVQIELASRAYNPRIRAEALLAAAESQDVKGVHIIKTMMTDPHLGIQCIALQLAANFPDEPIQRQAETIAMCDIPEAKLAAARLLSMQKAPAAKTVLTSLLTDETLSEEDQVEVAALLARLSDEVDLEWLQQAVIDPRPSIRALAASSVLSSPTEQALQALLPLLNDPSTHVKKCAFQTLGLWQSLLKEPIAPLKKAWESSLLSPSIDMSSTAAWAMLISSDAEAKEEATQWFKNAVTHSTRESALIATAHLIRTGEAGISLATYLITQAQDPLVQVNLSYYLLCHRKEISDAANILKTSLAVSQNLLGGYSDGIFSWFGTSLQPHHPGIPRLPESQDLLLRLQLLALRSYANQPIPKEEVEKMLNDRGWGVSASAAAFLFQEFGHSLDEVLTPLLSHETETIRIQAALLLTIISQSQVAAQTLAQQYEKASREGKEAIILGFSCLNGVRTKPYLVPLLFDSSPLIRTRTAGALLSSIYR